MVESQSGPSSLFCAQNVVRLGAAAAAIAYGYSTASKKGLLPGKPRKYPYARRDESVVDSYVDTQGQTHRIKDPFRWLEDPDSPETQRWVRDQIKTTSRHLDTCTMAPQIKAKLEESLNYERFSCPWKRGEHYFYHKNNGLQNHSVLYKCRTLDPTEQPEVFVDPNKLSEDGTTALKSASFSHDGSLAALMISRSGSDWSEIRIKRVSDCEDLSDVVLHCKFTSVAWTHDGQGFFYNRYPEIAQEDKGTETDTLANQQVFYHRIGTEQSEDRLILTAQEAGNKDWMFGLEVSDDGRYLVIGISDSCDPKNRLFFVDLDAQKADQDFEVVRLVDSFEASYDYITNEGPVFFFKTNLNAPRNKVVSCNIDKQRQSLTSPIEWTEVMPQHATDVLDYVCCAHGDKLVANYMHDVADNLKIFSLPDGRFERDVELPTFGTISGLSCRKEESYLFYKFTSFLYPGTLFYHDFASGETRVFRETKVPGLRLDQFVTEQKFYTSKDGTRIPMFIIRPSHVKLDGQNPTLLYGYGGFNISLKPSFSSSRVVFCQHLDAIYAIPSLRGGGEYGEEWHQAGTKLQKQNVFDDFAAAAEFLIDNGYTSSAKLAINGGSNGGLLVGATVNQRPGLFGCAMADVGVMDMLRFHRFTIGWAWCSDYGNADKDPAEFEALRAYSPLHNVRTDGQYPPMLLCTADHDDRVVPLHSFKLAAEMQYRSGDKTDNPLLIRIESKAGHGAGKGLHKQIQELSEKFAFVAKHLKAQWVQ